MKNSLRIHKWTHNEFNIFILGVLTHPLFVFLFRRYLLSLRTLKSYKLSINGVQFIMLIIKKSALFLALVLLCAISASAKPRTKMEMKSIAKQAIKDRKSVV